MDTSKKYIKMCDEAREIQDSLPLFSERRYSFFWADGKIGGWLEAINTKTVKYVWLPRQDQLQEMVIETSAFDGKRMVGLELCNFWAWYELSRPGDIGVEMKLWPSWEQLWLLFVMESKFNKEWRDKTWR